MKQRLKGLCLGLAVVMMGIPASVRTSAAADTVTVFAAASTTNALGDVGKLFMQEKMGTFIPSFASSSTLAKQIENGAPANIFLSADRLWMDYLAKRHMIDPATRFDLLGNKLVLIAPTSSELKNVSITQGFDLAGLLKGGKLAMGDPAHVPAGIYGEEALKTLGVWASVAKNVARSRDVRAALALVERGEVPLGIVYATDAAITNKVKVVGVFPESSHPPIVYPIVMIKGAKTPVTLSFLKFLKTPAAKAIFEKYGFTVR